MSLARKNVANIQTASTRLKSKNPNKRRYVNLLPAIATCNQLAGTPNGTPCSYTYQSYIKDFLSTATNVNLVTLDHYPFMSDGTTQANEWFISLEILRTEAKKVNKDYGAIIQGSPYIFHRNPNAEESMWQAMSALAYGSKMLNWWSWTGYNFTGEEVIGYGSSVIDRNQIASVNSKIKDYGQFLIKATSEAIWHADAGRPPGTQGRPPVDPVTIETTKPYYVGRFSIPWRTGKLILIGNRSLTTVSNAGVTICPSSNMGYVWVWRGSWILKDSFASPGQCTGFDLTLQGGDATLFYAE